MKAATTYYIYHIPDVKIGCTKQLPERRVKQQGYTEYTILEEHSDIEVAGNRERELQIQYGYGKDNNVLYHQVDLVSNGKRTGNIWGKINGKKNALNGHMDRIRSFEGSQKGGLKNVESGHIQNIQKIGSKIGNNKENRLKASISQKKTIKEKGLNKGEKNGNAKLNWIKVNEIRELWHKGNITITKLSVIFNVSWTSIKLIVTNKSWLSQCN